MRRVIGGAALLLILAAGATAAPPAREAKPGSQAGADATVLSVAFSPDGGRVAVGTRGGRVLLWQLGQAAERARLAWSADTGGPVALVGFATGGTQVVTGGGQVRLWDAGTGEPGDPLKGPKDPLALSADGRVLAGANGAQVKVWDTATGSAVATLAGHDRAPTAMAFSLDGSTLASVTGDSAAGQLIAWDLAKRQARKTLRLDGPASAVAVSPDNRTAAVTAGPQVEVWDLATGSVIWNRPLAAPLAFSPDAQVLVTGAPAAGTLLLWTARRAVGFAGISAGSGRIAALAFAPDSKTLATTAGDTVKLWDTATGRPVGTLVATPADAAPAAGPTRPPVQSPRRK
jgi:WD40 repeat protein